MTKQFLEAEPTKRVLIIGGDGTIGSHLVPFLRRKGFAVIETTRRDKSINFERLYLELLQQAAFAIPKNIDAAVVLAAAADYEKCDRDPSTSEINVVSVSELIQRLLERRIFTVFASSFTVFGGKLEYPGENMNLMPTVPYARQKAKCESTIEGVASRLSAENLLAIVRITRSFDSKTQPVPDWLEAWHNSKTARPFTDLFFAPVTLNYISRGLMRIIETRQGGIYHLSGSESIDYATFCRRLANRLGISETLLEPINSEVAGINLYFKPQCGALGMEKTTKVLGIEPQAVDAVIDGIAEEIHPRFVATFG